MIAAITGIEIAFPFLALIVFGAFVVLLIVVAKAAGRATRGPEDGRRGCLGGCGLAAVLAFLCLLAVVGLGAIVCFAAAVAAVDHNPIRSIEWSHDSSGVRPISVGGDTSPVRLRFVAERGFVGDLADWLTQVVDGDVRLSKRDDVDDEGNEVTICDFYLPFSRHELMELERDIRRELPGFREGLPEVVRIEFRGADRGF